jgi:3-oxoacyl-[acyl-carrier protein] reductase
MQGKAVVITGGANGLGLATARLAAARGARGVALIDIDRPALDAAVAAISGAGCGHAVGIEGDVTDRESARRAFDRAVEAFGWIDALINCAGVYPRRPILEISDEDWNRSFAVNVRGT